MIERLAEQLFNDFKNSANEFSAAADGGARKAKSLFEAQLRKMNLVSREEFDAQAGVLRRTREKLETLERELENLKKEVDDLK